MPMYRACEGCGAKMSPFQPRKRNSQDLLVCPGCKQREGMREIRVRIASLSAEAANKVIHENELVRIEEDEHGEQYFVIHRPYDPADPTAKVFLMGDDPRQFQDRNDVDTKIHEPRDPGDRAAMGYPPLPDKKKQGSTQASRLIAQVDGTPDEVGEVADRLQAMVRSNGGQDVQIEQESGSGRVVVATSNDLSAEWAADLGQRLPSIPGVTSLTFEAGLSKVAHDSGDGQTIYHCPFCGAGQVTGRSDGTAECSYCTTSFTVQVQPQMPAMPQTNPETGEPIDMPGMPGSQDDPFQEEIEPEEAQEDVEDAEEEDNPFPFQSSAQGGSAEQMLRPGEFRAGDRFHESVVEDIRYARGGVEVVLIGPDGSRKVTMMNGKRKYPIRRESSYYLTPTGAALDEQAYLRHLAIHHADDREAVLQQIRQTRENQR